MAIDSFPSGVAPSIAGSSGSGGAVLPSEAINVITDAAVEVLNQATPAFVPGVVVEAAVAAVVETVVSGDTSVVVSQGASPTAELAAIATTVVNVASAIVETVAAQVPGSNLAGEWTMEAVEVLVDLFEAMSPYMKSYIHGLTYSIQNMANEYDGTEEEKKLEAAKFAELMALVKVDVQRREVKIKAEAFNLPPIDGRPAVHLALTAALGKVAIARSGKLQAFSRLSGWTLTVRDGQGKMTAPPTFSAGELPEVSQAAPAPRSRSGVLPGAPAAPRLPRATGTQPLRDGDGAKVPPVAGVPPRAPSGRLAGGPALPPPPEAPTGRAAPKSDGQQALEAADGGTALVPRTASADPGLQPAAALDGAAAVEPAGEASTPVEAPAPLRRTPAKSPDTSPASPQARSLAPDTPARAGGEDGMSASASRSGDAPASLADGRSAAEAPAGRNMLGSGAAPLVGGKAAPGAPAPKAMGGTGELTTLNSKGVAPASAAKAVPGAAAALAGGKVSAEPGVTGNMANPGSKSPTGTIAANAINGKQPGVAAAASGKAPASPSGPLVRPGEAPPAGKTAGTNGLMAAGERSGTQPGSGLLRPGSGPLGTGKLPGGSAAAARSGVVDGAGRVALGPNAIGEFHHDPDAAFVGGPEADLDPRSDFGESLKAFMFKPETLLGKSPAKFLFLNAEMRQFPPSKVLEMAKALGVDLSAVVTDMLVAGKATQATVSRICEVHGLAANAVTLKARDQQLLAKGANMAALADRLVMDLGANGPASAKHIREAEALSAKFTALASRLNVVRDPSQAGLPAGQRVFAWFASTAAKLGGEGPLAKVDAQMSELRAQFQRLPLAAQLKVDPQMALGAAWFRLSAEERSALKNPSAVQGLIATATEKVDAVGYLPQRLNASEKRALATQTLVDALMDTGAAGAAFRSKFGGLAAGKGPAVLDPVAALRDLPARNGDSVLLLLGANREKELSDKRNNVDLRNILSDPAMADALASLRRGAQGSEQIRATMLRFAMEAGRKDMAVTDIARGLVETLKSERINFQRTLGANALELALTEVNRQVQEANMVFITAFVSKKPGALEDALGPWLFGALSPAERKMLEDADYRQHLVDDAQTLRATGASMAEEAHQYQVQTENIQATLDFLTRPDEAFRREFERDPVGALMRRGIYQNLPDAVQQMLANENRKTPLAALTKAVESAIAPILQRQIGHQRQIENLKSAIKTVNASNYKPILGVLDLGEAEMSRAVHSSLTSAMAFGDRDVRAGIIQFL